MRDSESEGDIEEDAEALDLDKVNEKWTLEDPLDNSPSLHGQGEC